MSRISTVDRFWAKVTKTNTCWLWTGAISDKYGDIGVQGKTVRAHRFSYALHYGPIPDGLKVLHSCDNPPCVRPDHLFLGTQRNNVEDMISKGRQKYPPSKRNTTHITTESTKLKMSIAHKAYWEKRRNAQTHRQ